MDYSVVRRSAKRTDGRRLEYKTGGFTTHIDGRPIAPNPAIRRKQYPGATLPQERPVTDAERRQRSGWDPSRPITLPTVPDDFELRKDGRRRFVVVPRSLVPEDFLSAAWQMVKRASATLGLPLPPSVIWVAEPGTDLARLASIKAWGEPEYVAGNIECGGWYDPRKPDTIHVVLRDGMDTATVAAIVAHEVKHRSQHKQGGKGQWIAYKDDPARWEDDANRFMEAMMASWDGGA